jgi:hypothetical protein
VTDSEPGMAAGGGELPRSSEEAVRVRVTVFSLCVSVLNLNINPELESGLGARVLSGTDSSGPRARPGCYAPAPRRPSDSPEPGDIIVCSSLLVALLPRNLNLRLPRRAGWPGNPSHRV